MSVVEQTNSVIIHDREPHSVREHIDDFYNTLNCLHVSNKIDCDLLEMHVTKADRKTWQEGIGRWNFIVDKKYKISFELDRDKPDSIAVLLSERGKLLDGSKGWLNRGVITNVTEISTGNHNGGIRCLVGSDQEIGVYYWWKEGLTFYTTQAKNVPF